MSYNLPPLKPQLPKATQLKITQGTQYGIPDPMVNGVPSSKDVIHPKHPLEASEKLYAENQVRLSMQMMQNLQGLHAPLKLGMELRAARKVGRLPFLPSSNLMYDTLTGRDDRIDFDDILNIDEFNEKMPQPHILIEKLWDN